PVRRPASRMRSPTRCAVHASAAPGDDGAQAGVADALTDAMRGPRVATGRIAKYHRVDARMLGEHILEERELVALDLAAQVQFVAGDAKLHRRGGRRSDGERDEKQRFYCLVAAFLALPADGAPSCGQ